MPTLKEIQPQRPTLGRVVHYRLKDRWILAFVVDDVGATPNLARELELHPGVKGLGFDKPAPNAEVGCAAVNDHKPVGVTVLNVVRGEEPGQWRWPPREP